MNDRSRRITKINNSNMSFAHEPGQSEVIAAVPCFNEDLFIGSVVLKAKQYVDRVIVVDDGSTDRTAMVAERAGAVVLRHDYNKGKGAAIGTAFEHAKGTACRALVLLDGDGQHDPVFIPSLIKPVLDGEADVVVGSRYLEIKTTIPTYRTWGHHLLTLLTNLGSRTRLTDSQSGFRAFSPKAIAALSFTEDGLSVESEMQFLANEAGLRVIEVPISMVYHTKAKRSPLAHGMGVLNSIVGLISRRIPLLFFGVPGLVMLGFGLREGWRVIEAWNHVHDFWLGPALVAVLLCIVGTLSVFTGVILHTVRSFLR
jgi:glycosyltransferase involved in cell wall biosynthesis